MCVLQWHCAYNDLLIAPEGIEIPIVVKHRVVTLLLIAPEGIEMTVVNGFLYDAEGTLNRTRRN